MTTHIYPIKGEEPGLQKRVHYGTILSDIVRACSDATKALNLFRGLVLGQSQGPDSLGFIAFDAHCGDAGCQLRAGMLREIFLQHRETVSGLKKHRFQSTLWIEPHIQRLVKLRQNAEKSLHLLTHEKFPPETLGFGAKKDYVENIVKALERNEYTCEENHTAGRNNGVGIQVETMETNSGYELEREGGISWVDDDSFSSKRSPGPSSGSTTSASEDSSSSSRGFTMPTDSSLDINPLWDPSNSFQVARFLVYAFTLSRYKKFCRQGKCFGMRLDLEGILVHGLKLTKCQWNVSNKDYQVGKKQGTKYEVRRIQAWLCQLTCSWVCSLAERSPSVPNINSLIRSTIQTAANGVTSVACYPGYLSVREDWSRGQASMVMIDRHFCSEGVHLNLFAVRHGLIENDIAAFAHGPKIQWLLEEVSVDDLARDADQIVPRLVVFGNSIDGSYEDYVERITWDVQVPMGRIKPHCSAEMCLENSKHVADFSVANHDRIALATMAAHDLYQFELPFGEDAKTFLSRCFDGFSRRNGSEVQGEALRAYWQRSEAEVNALGAGKQDMHLFAWQHVFLETNARLAHQVEEMKSSGLLLISGRYD